MRWFWVFLLLFFLTACSDDASQDTVFMSIEQWYGMKRSSMID